MLVYALFLQCIPGFTRVARATVLPKFVPPPVTATITDAVVSRHKPTLTHGRIEGSLRVLLGESFTINNATAITSDVYLPGSPSIQVNNGASHGGMISDGGSASPGNYALTLANNASIPGHIHTQADAPDLPPVATSVPAATGNRTVTITSQSQVDTIGDWSTVRDLNISGSHLVVDMPAGNYRSLTINGNSQVNFTAGTYNFANTFNLDGSGKVQATGAVVINVAQNLTINSGALTPGSYTTPGNIQLNVLGSTLKIRGSSQISAFISAYHAEATLSGTSQVRGRVIADKVTLNGGKVIAAVWPAVSGSSVTLFGPRRFDRTSGSPNQYVEQFSIPEGATSPFILHIQNGSIEGTNRVSSATIKLNGVEILSPNDLNQNVPSVERTITLSDQNQLDVSLASDPGSYLIIYITGTVSGGDTTPPSLEVTNPINNYSTTDSQITFNGSASDPGEGASGIAHVYVNNVEASYNSATNTWTLSNVSLSVGPNEFVVRAVDQAGNETTVPINVTREAPENHSPTVDAGADQTITLPNNALLDGNATDDGFPEGSSLITTWSKVSGPGTVTFGDASQLSTSASFSIHGSYLLRLTATDGQLSKSDDVTITVDPQNQPPTVNAGPDQTIALPSNATLNGTITDDGFPAPSTVTSLWTVVSGPGTVTFADPTLAETTATFSEAGLYELKLMATDGELTSHDEVKINVHPENHAPTVNSGADQIISLPADAQLSGTATDDGWPYGSTLTTLWTVVSGPGPVVIADPNALSTTASFTVAGPYIFRLTGSDGQLSATDDITIVVTPPNQAPVVNAGADQIISLPEDTVNLNGTVTDDGLPIGSTLAFSWTVVSGPGAVTFGNANQVATTAQFAATGDYVLRLTASDGALSHFDEVAVKLTPQNQAPVVGAGADQTIALPASAALSGSVTDDNLPPSSSLSMTWSKVSGPGTVTFANPNAAVTTASFSEPGPYVLRLTSTDSQLTTSDDISILVDPENQAPAVNAGADQTITLPASASLQGTATDDGYPRGSSLSVVWSKVSGPGTVTFSNPSSLTTTASFSVAGTYVLGLTASDSAITKSDEVQVIVIPQNFAPTVNAGADQTVTMPNTANLNGTVTDDGLPSGSTLTTVWTKVSGPGNVTFANASAVNTTASFSAGGTYVLRLSASDSELTTSDELTVNVIDPRIPPVANFIVPQSTGAAGGFVIASSGFQSSAFAADNVLDNNNATSWFTNGQTNQFAKIQFYDQQSVFLDRVRIQGHQGGTGTANVKDFDVQVSATTSDDSSFVTVLTATYVNNGLLQEFVFPGGPARARFVKFLPKNSYLGSGNITIGTFNPVSVGSIDSIVSLPGDINGARSQSPGLILNGAAIHSASYVSGTNSAYGILGYFGGGWTTQGTANQFAIIQLGGTAPATIQGVRMAPGSNGGSAVPVKDFEIWVSATTPDPASFTRVLTASTTNISKVLTYQFPGGPVQARYVKYVPLTNQGGATTGIETGIFDVVAVGGARVVGVSSEQANGPGAGEAAFDGDTNSTWISAQNVVTNVWIKTALTDEAVQKVYGVRITPLVNSNTSFGPKDFDIRVSTTTTDDSAFTTVFSGTSANFVFGAPTTQEFLFPNVVDAKYVQFFFKNGYQTSAIAARELEVLTYPARGSAIVAFSSQDELASNCVDLDPLGQVWSTASGQTTNQWIKLLMPRGELANINHFAVRPGIASNGFYSPPKDFEFQVSTTDAADTSFTTVLSGTFANNTQLQDYYFPTTQARYVRLLLKNNYGAPRTGVASFYVYAADEIGTTTRFFDQSTDADGPIVTWAWDFGDGTTSSQRNPTHTYAQTGTYVVTLTVTDQTGLQNTRQATYRVLESLRPQYVNSPLIVHEGGEISRFQDITRLMLQPTAQRRYVFGDGGTLNQNLFQSIYTYQDNGTFNSTLTIGDPQGLTHTATRTVVVLNMPPSVAIDDGKTVVWGENWTSAPQITEQSPIDRVSLQGQWTFGDGQSSSCVNCTNANATITHSYANPGTYTATLTITDKDGGVGSDSAVFTVNKRPTAIVFTNPPPATASGPLTIQAQVMDTFANVALAGKPVQFSVNGAIFSAVTNAQGTAEITVPFPAGTRVNIITGTFAGDAFYLSGSGVTVPVTAGTAPPAGVPSNSGTDFWLMFPQNYADGNQRQKLFITSRVATSGTVTIPGLNFNQNYTVAANSVTTVELGNIQSNLVDAVENRGIHVTALQPVVVYGMNQRAFTSDAYMGLPVPTLGLDHLVVTYSNLDFEPSSGFGIVATQNGTIVTITPSTVAGSRPAGVPYNITLNQGQTYQNRSVVPTAAGDLTGTRITANKPIGVYGTHVAATIPAEAVCCADHLVEQLPPIPTWGKRFATIPIATRLKGDFFRYVAAEDGTSVYLNGQLAAVINKGQWFERIIKTPTEVIATKPIMVAQFATSIFYDPGTTSKADPFIMIIPPYSQFLNHYTVTTPPTGFTINYINVVAPTAALGTITMDGTPIPAASFTPIGVSGYSGAQIAVNVGSHNFDGPSAFGLFMYGFAQDEGYGYTGGMNMTPTVNATNVVVTPETSSHSINTQACLTATTTDQDQNPLGGQTISFSVTGANPSSASTQTTDAAGQATLCYTGTTVGTDQVAATFGTWQGTASVVWTPPNQPPVVNAGLDQTITMPLAASLAGSVTDDGLPANSLTVSWSKLSGPGNVVFANANSPVTTATFSVDGVYVLRLSANDTALTAFDDVQITVNPAPPNQAPTVNAGPDTTATINGNLVLNAGNDDELVEGEISHWTEVQGSTWTHGNAGSEPQRGSSYFFAGDAAAAELRQDIDVSAFAGSIAAGLQQFEFKAYVRSAVEATPDTARVVVEYRDAGNTNVIATIDSNAIASTSAWHLTEDLRTVPAGTGWIRIRLIATRNSGTTNDAFFDSISLRPIGNAAVKLHGTATDDGLPYGSSLSTSWSAVSGPGTVSFTNANSLDASAAFTVAGTYVLRLTGTDGDLSHTDDVSVVVNPINLAPVVNAGANQTITLPASATLSGSATDDGQPPGSSLSLSWAKVAGPGIVSFANAGATETTATFGLAGVYTLRLTADDTEYSSSSDVTITVNPAPVNQPPTVDAGADQVISMPVNTANLNGVVNDDGLPPGSTLSINWSMTSGAGTVTFGNANNAVTTAQFSAVGTYVLRLTVSDGEYTVFDEVVISVTPANEAPTANAGADQSILLSQEAFLSGAVSDDGLPSNSALTTTWTKFSGPGTVTFNNPNAISTTATFSAVGVYVLRLTASDGSLSTSDDVTITVNENVAPPTVAITAPDNDASVTEPAIVTGSVSGGAWILEYSLCSDDNPNNRVWTQFGSGNGATTGNLGTLDPTMMLNGLFDIRLSATDEYGQISRIKVSVIVEKNLKIGNFSLSFTDLSVPVAGVPMEVMRTYDSRDKRVGDFGFGWTLNLRSIRVEKSSVLGMKWFETVSQEVIPNYCLQPVGTHTVAVTFPNGKVFKFQPVVEPQCQRFVPITSGTISFAPMPGTHGKLEVVGSADVQIDGSVPGPVNLIGFGGGVDIFNSFVFKFTAEDGTSYIIDQRTGLKSLSDPNGNSLTVGPGGIVHSSGKSIVFNRDGLGRITSITDPAGNIQTYTYDQSGDLVTHTDAENNPTRFVYDTSHRLLEIIDARGVHGVRTEYDDAGRIIKVTDANGGVIEYDHNLVSRQETITTRNGNTLTLTYDQNGNVLQERDALGGTTTYTYDAEGNKTSETNSLNQTTAYTYDAAGHILTRVTPEGTSTYTYNPLGQLLTSTDQRGNVTTLTYDGQGDLLTRKIPSGVTVTYTYDSHGNLLTSSDTLGITRFEYDQAGNKTKITDTLGKVRTTTYDTNGNVLTQTATVTNGAGQVETLTTTYEYNKQNRPVKVTNPDNTVVLTEYNSLGVRSAIVDTLNRRTEFEYDNVGHLILTRYPDGTTDSTAYDSRGLRVSTTDRDGLVTTYTYDVLGRLTKTTFPDSKWTATTYDSAGRVLTKTDERGNVTTYEYDPNCSCSGRRSKIIDALNGISTFVYDATGNLVSSTGPNGETTTFESDASGHRTKTTYPDSTHSETVYDTFGRAISESDQSGKTTHFEYDSLDRLIKTKDALNNEVTNVYDEVGRMISQTDSNGHTTRFEYDKMGHVVKRILPGGGSETFTYDVAGRVTSRRDFNGKTTTYEYDVMGRLKKRTPDASFNQPPITYTYTPSGRRETMTDSTGTTTYTYDNRHRLISKAAPNGTLTYTYDGVGNLLTMRSSNANGASVDYSYNQLNRLSTVTDNRIGGTTTYNFDAMGTLHSYTLPNGVKSEYTYDSLSRLTDMTVKNVASATIADYAYTLGPAGNRLTMTELNGRHVAYTYDDLYRLTNEAISNDPSGVTNGAISYTYDNAGNRLSRNSTVTAVPSATYQYDINDRLTSNSNDANGNVTVQQGNTYSYDFEDRLVDVNNGNVTMVHDGDGQLVSKTVNGVTTKYLVSEVNLTGHPQIVEEIRNGNTEVVYTYGLMLLSQNQFLNGSWNPSFYGLDGHSNVRFLTNVAGAITDTYDYDAFGNLIASTGNTPNTRLYAGERFDPNVGFYHLRARYYDQGSGRFITGDKFPSSAYDPQSLHRYVYAQNDPVNRIDPSGNWSTTDTIATVTMIGILAASVVSMVTLQALTYYYLPSNAFHEWPDAAIGGLAFTGSPTKAAAKYMGGPANPYVEAVAIGLLLTTVSAGVEVLKPFHSPAVWAYAYMGPNFSFDTDNITGAFDPSNPVTVNAYAGAVWNTKTASDYAGSFFCSQASSMVLKGAITHMDFSWFHDSGINFRDPMTLSATLCVSPADENPAYSLTFGRDRSENARFKLSSSYFYYVGGEVPYVRLPTP